MVNQYTGITNYYDLLMMSGYYDYHNIAKKAYSIVGNNCQILEIGVGTGLLAEKYMEIDNTCQFTGVDITPSFVEIAKKRLGNKAKLIVADALTMELNKTFDVAISHAGVWLFISCGDRLELVSHIPDVQANYKGLQNLARHLRTGSLLLLSIQKSGINFEKNLPGGIIYSQLIEELEDKVDYHTRKKSYFFKKDGEIIAQEKLTITLFRQNAYQKLFDEAGFDFQGINNDNSLAIYKKR
ncbi:trans-aconitate 2-methyltransferase [Hydrocoleum sp. CS-953]|uniref:class I SAM-dependent methyltransferase n=1 Tax=Hydrocoleum sp. CS-953 TaxID=1671698 RepID=UPI000B9B7DC7|nr:class I SAM-dependent methyltransferase [Hydrocoleum sp. CS-953]